MDYKIKVKDYIKNLIIEDENIKELMTNMSITTLPVSKIFKITGPMTPQELYEYIYNPENHALLAELGFKNNVNYQIPKAKSSYDVYSSYDEGLIGMDIESMMYEVTLPSKLFYKKMDK